ncbi:MAG TPA: glycosyltransferase family 39 protein [Bacteroidales bacterium]|nr:glycosyltransferase family 39 protein [Bacteroidales bacterium]
MKKGTAVLVLIFAGTLSFLMHYRQLGKELMSIHVWRQTQTQSTINNFYEEDFNILNPARNERGAGDGIFRMEFPLMQWLMALLYKIFGSHLLITRLFMFVTGLFTVTGLYILIRAVLGRDLPAAIGAWAFTFSPAFYYYTINPIPDVFALCFSVWGLALFFAQMKHPSNLRLFLSGLFLSIGTLVKLPFILYYSVPAVYFILQITEKGLSRKLVLKAITVFIFLGLPAAWYIYVIPQWNNGIVGGMLDNHASFTTIMDYLQHNLISTLPELLLNYGALPFFIAGFYFIARTKAFRSPVFIMLAISGIAVLAYFFFEINMIAKIHDYYLFPFYPLLFLIVAYGAYRLIMTGKPTWRYLSLVLLILLPVTAYLRMKNRWNPDSPGFNRDLLVYKDDLRNAVPDNALVVTGNDISHYIFFYYIHKKGWGFDDDDLRPDRLSSMINEGARYLYSDSRKVDRDPAIIPYLDTLVLHKGTIMIFRLKEPD